MRTNYENFANALKTRRTALGLSLRDLSRRALKEDGRPISPQYLCDMERGARAPSAGVLCGLAEGLGVNPSYFEVLLGRLPADVFDYVAARPESAEGLCTLLRRAAEIGFDDWDSIALPPPGRAAAGVGR